VNSYIVLVYKYYVHVHVCTWIYSRCVPILQLQTVHCPDDEIWRQCVGLQSPWCSTPMGGAPGRYWTTLGRSSNDREDAPYCRWQPAAATKDPVGTFTLAAGCTNEGEGTAANNVPWAALPPQRIWRAPLPWQLAAPMKEKEQQLTMCRGQRSRRKGYGGHLYLGGWLCQWRSHE
jgi:hypothetical protein